MSEKLLPDVVQPWYDLLEASIRPGTRSGTTFTAYFITVRGGHQDPDLVPEIWYQTWYHEELIAKQAPIQPRKAVPDLVPAEYHGGGAPPRDLSSFSIRPATKISETVTEPLQY